MAEAGRFVLVHGVDDAEAVGGVFKAHVHLGMVVAEGLLRAADFFAPVFDEVLDVVGLVDFFARDFFQREIDFGVVALGAVLDATDVNVTDGFAFEAGSAHRLRRGGFGRSFCCGFGDGGGFGRRFGGSAFDRRSGRFGSGVFFVCAGGGQVQAEQGEAECG